MARGPLVVYFLQKMEIDISLFSGENKKIPSAVFALILMKFN